MEQAFALFDADGSGVISREEFKAALERLGFQGDADRTDLPALTEEEIEALIDSADANGDGECDCATEYIVSIMIEYIMLYVHIHS